MRKIRQHLFNGRLWFRGQLILFNLKYSKYRWFKLIDENGCYFVSHKEDRKSGDNGGVTRMARLRHSPGGEQTDDVIVDLYRQYIDVEVETRSKCGDSTKEHGLRI